VQVVHEVADGLRFGFKDSAGYIEAHPRPPEALSDAATQLDLEELDRLVGQLEAVSKVVREVAP
ncbi:MAG: hypothetical protein P8Y93_14295, partial [Acidobacteriota bacterium]